MRRLASIDASSRVAPVARRARARRARAVRARARSLVPVALGRPRASRSPAADAARARSHRAAHRLATPSSRATATARVTSASASASASTSTARADVGAHADRRARARRMTPRGARRARDAARRARVAALVAALARAVGVVVAQTTTTNCVAHGQTAIFVAFSPNAPDAVFRSDYGCLAGGGRGVGCCPGSVCASCEEESNEVAVDGGATVTLRFFSCLCAPCPAGTAQPLAAQKTCEKCPAGWFNTREGQATCEPCPVGTFSTKVGNTVGCAACAAGTSGKSTLADYYEKTTRAYRAPATGDGSTFDPTLAATSCQDCPAGTSGGGAGDACTPCAPGYFSAARAETCAPCPVGTYSTLPGGASIDSCLPCAAGESNDAVGSTECWQVCPSSLLSCADAAVKAKGEYDALEAARARPRVFYTDDGIDDYRARLCKLGCETFATDHWCPSFGLPNVNDCDAYAPPPPAAAAARRRVSVASRASIARGPSSRRASSSIIARLRPSRVFVHRRARPSRVFVRRASSSAAVARVRRAQPSTSAR